MEITNLMVTTQLAGFGGCWRVGLSVCQTAELGGDDRASACSGAVRIAPPACPAQVNVPQSVPCYTDPCRGVGPVPLRMDDEDIIEQQTLPTAMAEPQPLPVFAEPIEYPDSDGHFLPDNPLQSNAIVELRFSLKEHFRGVPNVVLEGDMFLYYAQDEADERRVRGRRVGKYVAPDVFVVLDHDLGGRLTYKLWEEGKAPDFALEVISPSSELRNRRDKKELYGRIGVQEYFLFQPDVRRPSPRVVGYTLRGGAYRELGPDATLPGAEAVVSEVLGVSLRPEGAFLRVRDQRSGKDYPWMEEAGQKMEALSAARGRAEQRANREAAARRSESERADREAAARRSESERADRANERADREAAARRSAEARTAALEARLDQIAQRPLDDD